MKKQQWTGGLIGLLAVLGCVLLILLPKFFAKWGDRALFDSFHPRPPVEGLLDEEAQDIPIVYALYRKRYLQQSSKEEYLDRLPEEEMETERKRLEKLAHAKAIPVEYAERINLWRHKAERVNRIYQQQTGFYTNNWTGKWDEEQQRNEEVTVEWDKNTEQVVTLSLRFFEEISPTNAEECLQGYQEYLEVTSLDDWIAAPSNSSSNALLWSEKGQLYLYCSVGSQEFQMGARSMTKQDVQQFFEENRDAG